MITRLLHIMFFVIKPFVSLTFCRYDLLIFKLPIPPIARQGLPSYLSLLDVSNTFKTVSYMSTGPLVVGVGKERRSKMVHEVS